MIVHFIAVAATAVALLVGTISPALSKTLSVSLGEAKMVVTVPDNWKVTEIKRGLQIVSPDEEVYVWAETVLPGQSETVRQEHRAYFVKQKVTFGEPKTQEGELNGMKTTATDYPDAKYAGAKTILQYLLVKPDLKNDAQLLLTAWASVEGEQKHRAATGALLNGLKLEK